MNDTPSHFDLLTIARALRQAAIAEDIDNVHTELMRLRNALVHHLFAEEAQLAVLHDAAALVVRHGQQQLLNALDDLLCTAEDENGSCICIVHAAQVELMVRRQARLELAVAEDESGARSRSPDGTQRQTAG